MKRPEKLEILYPVSLAPVKRPVFVVAKRLFSANQCRELLDFAESHRRFFHHDGSASARDVKIFYLEPTDLKWPFLKIASAASSRNVWNFSLSGFAHAMRIQKYSRGGFTDAHTDFEYESSDPSKITAVIPLVKRRSWTGGQLQIGNHAAAPGMDLGDCVFFPSFYFHWVTPVTRGTRITLSAWLVGPPFV